MTSSYGNTFHHAEDVDSGQFAFTAVEAGDYMACFTANGHKPEVTLSIDFDWRTGIHSKSWGSVAKKSQVEVSLSILFGNNSIVLFLCLCVVFVTKGHGV